MATLKAVTRIGLQDDDQTYVFGPNLHFDEKGNKIGCSERNFMWVPEILDKLQCPMNSLEELPHIEGGNPLNFIVCGFKTILGKNLASGISMLGKPYSLLVQFACMRSRT